MNTSLLLALPVWALLAVPAPTPAPTLYLKDGRVFLLKEAPRTEGGRVVFTTLDGKAYSLRPDEVQSFVGAPATPTRGPITYNPQDSRALGAIARQERDKTGKTSDLSASSPTRRPTLRPTKPKKTPTASPKPSATTRTPAVSVR